MTPGFVDYRTLKESISSARQLNNIVKRLKRVKRKGALDLVKTETGVTTKYELNEARIAFSVQERRKSMERKARGIEIGERFIGSRHLAYIELAPATVKPPQMTQKQRKRLIEVQTKASAKNRYDKAADMYANYVSGMETVGMDVTSPVLYADIENMIEYAAENEPEFLSWVFDTYGERVSIDFVYDDAQTMTTRAKVIRDAWNDAREEWNRNHA